MFYEGAPRDTIMSKSGMEVDITEQIGRLLRIGEYGDWHSPETARWIRTFGVKLIAVAGVEAPARLVAEYEEELPAEFAASLRETWHAIALLHE